MNTFKPDIDSLLPWVEARFSRSPGPGGQNVNKVNTQVTLLFDYMSCSRLTDFQKRRISSRLSTRMSRDGRLRVVSRRERTQGRNRSAAQVRLIEILTAVMQTPRPRRKTRATMVSKRRRLQTKRQRGERKRQRGMSGNDG